MQKCTMEYCTHVGAEGGGINYMQILKRWVFKDCLKEDVDAEWRTSYGNELHCVGPVKEKACCPKVFVFVKGTWKVLVSEMEQSCLDGW